MKANREVLEDHLQEYEQQVKGLKSYIKELTAQAERHETEKSQYEMDLIEAEHNVKYYDAEIGRIRKELGGGAQGGGRPQAGILPRTARQGIGSFVFSTIGFIAGAVLGSKMKSKGKDRREPGDER
jgi:outer membrane lipoprotein SlyB